MTATSTRRIPALDGLRGLAALVVLVGHCVMASAHELAGVEYGAPAHTTLAWLLGETPLHLLWGGGEAVIVFFVLSGFVLALPTANGRPFSLSYYPRRLVRLYVPALAALALGGVLYTSVSHDATGLTRWLAESTIDPASSEVARDAVLVRGGDFRWDSSLWSLRWEVVFSMLLPGYLLLARHRRLAAPLAILSVVAIAAAPNDYLRFLPVFMLGVLLAYHRPRLPHPALVAAGALAGLSALRWMPGDAGYNDFSVARGLVALGAAAAVCLPLTSPGFARFLTTPVMRWAGTRSFSLYLVHAPMIVAIAFLFDAPTTLPLMLAAIPAALLLTEGFYRAVERPSHGLSRAAGELRLRGLERAYARRGRAQRVEAVASGD